MISVDHPTDRPNFYIVSTPVCRVAFSYQTPIAVYPYRDVEIELPDGPHEGIEDWDHYCMNGYQWWVSQNEWSTTTGKHLNWIDPDHTGRVSNELVRRIITACFKEGALNGS